MSTFLPPLTFASGPSGASQNSSGASWSASRGDWTVNVAGSGPALQAAMGGLNVWWIVAGVAAWYLLKK